MKNGYHSEVFLKDLPEIKAHYDVGLKRFLAEEKLNKNTVVGLLDTSSSSSSSITSSSPGINVSAGSFDDTFTSSSAIIASPAKPTVKKAFIQKFNARMILGHIDLVDTNYPKLRFLDSNESVDGLRTFCDFPTTKKDRYCSLRVTLWTNKKRGLTPSSSLMEDAIKKLVVGHTYDIMQITGLHYYFDSSPRANVIIDRVQLTTVKNGGGNLGIEHSEEDSDNESGKHAYEDTEKDITSSSRPARNNGKRAKKN